MNIQIDSREKAKAIKSIVNHFDKTGIKYFVSKLFVGDYMSFDNPRLIVDRKQNLQELCGNVGQQHKRFISEINRANENDIKLIFLCEHSTTIKALEDVKTWINPRISQYCFKLKYALGIYGEYNENYLYKRCKELNIKPFKSKTGVPLLYQPPISGEKLYKILNTIQNNYNVEFKFCSKSNTGKEIICLLGGVEND